MHLIPTPDDAPAGTHEVYRDGGGKLWSADKEGNLLPFAFSTPASRAASAEPEGCPFCGSLAVQVACSGDGYQVRCTSCGAGGPVNPTPHKAVGAWAECEDIGVRRNGVQS